MSNRFTRKETKQLAAIAKVIEFTEEHAERAEGLRWEELTTDEYELSIAEAYRSQVSALHLHSQRLMDLRLEQDKHNADRIERGIAQGWEILHALQAELTAIVDRYYVERFGTESE